MHRVIRELLAASEAGVGLLACCCVAWTIARLNGFYRRELRQEDKNRLTPLDGLRGILCYLVMFHHAAMTRACLDRGVWSYVWPPSRIAEMCGSGAVALFFCTTGFLFWSRALATQGKINPGPFLRARLFRIAPAYLLSCLLVLTLASSLLRRNPVDEMLTVGRMAGLGFLNWWGDGGPNLLPYNAGVQWSLAFEWAFYFALPALALCAVEGRTWLIALVGVAMLRITGWGAWVFFAPGIAAAYFAGNHALLERMRSRPMSAIILLAIAAYPFATLDPLGPVGLLFTAIIFIPIACGNDLFGFLQLTGLRLMGIVSYSFYLLHGSFLYMAHPLLRATLDRTHDATLPYWTCIWGLSVVVTLLCAASYRFIEWPAIQYEKRWRAQRGTDTIVRKREEAVLQTS
jgi:peptidoglycan/LPS O-acetylase OafA/YrhL